MDIINKLKDYTPYNEQEKVDRDEILKHIATNEDIFLRDNKAMHMTASAWIVNKKRDKVLMAYHNIYDSWGWLGGHADGEKDLLKLAALEAVEESGISQVTPITQSIFSLETLIVEGHEKNGEYVPSHLHLNVTYLFQANEDDNICSKPDENSDVKWFYLDEAVNASSEKWFRERIYSKLNEKLRVVLEI